MLLLKCIYKNKLHKKKILIKYNGIRKSYFILKKQMCWLLLIREYNVNNKAKFEINH
jgi:hypothetical protein